jgi:hypothetical protein
MDPIRLFSIISWILLPAVMFGGYSLLHLQVRKEVLTPFQETYFRAGHAHASVLLLLSLLYYQYLGHTSSSILVRWIACIAVLVGLLAVAGGFFLHMERGGPGRGSAGVLVTNLGAVLLALATLLLAYLIIAA